MIIGINGKINSGKDTIGKIIQYLSYCDTFGRMSYSSWEILDKTYNKSEWQIKKFADKLKDIVCLLINCTREQLEDREFKEKELGEEWNYYHWNTGEYEDYNEGICITEKEAINIINSSYTGNYELIKLTPRTLLQLIGTECGREIIHPNLWVNALMSEYKGESPFIMDKSNGEPDSYTFPNWIITDVRFPNELKVVKDKGGITIRVNKLNIKTIKDGDSTIKYIPIPNVDYKEHESEIALDNAEFDYEIDNNGTIEDLIKQVKEILIKEKLIN